MTRQLRVRPASVIVLIGLLVHPTSGSAQSMIGYSSEIRTNPALSSWSRYISWNHQKD